MDPDIKKRFSEKYGVEVNEVNFDNLEAMVDQAPQRARQLRPHLAEHRVRLPPQPGGPAGPLRPRPAAQQREGHLELLRRPWWDPQHELSVPYTYYTTGIAWRDDEVSRDDRLVERPDEPGRRGADVHPRRLPGGDRRGEPDQRLRPQHRAIPTSSSSPKQTLLDQKENARGFSTNSVQNLVSGPRSSTRPGTATSSTSATRSTTRALPATRPARRASRSAPT